MTLTCFRFPNASHQRAVKRSGVFVRKWSDSDSHKTARSFAGPLDVMVRLHYANLLTISTPISRNPSNNKTTLIQNK